MVHLDGAYWRSRKTVSLLYTRACFWGSDCCFQPFIRILRVQASTQSMLCYDVGVMDARMKQVKCRRLSSIAIVVTLLAGAWPSNAPLAAEQSEPSAGKPSSIPVDLQTPDRTSPTQFLPPLEPGQSSATRWLQLIDQATLGDSWQEPASCRKQAARDRKGMCRLHWRKPGGLSSLRGRYDEYSYDLTLRVAGKHLADHLEFDVDRSPEVRLRYDFD